MSNIRSKDTTNTKDKIIKDKKETRVLNKNLFATNEAPKKETIRKNTKVKNKKSSDDHSSDSSELSEHNNFNESNCTVDEFMNNTKNIFTNILNTQAFDDEPKIKQKSKYPKDSELDINLNVDELVGNCDDFIHDT
jgi:IMP dehydrogenase/GMP reductase